MPDASRAEAPPEPSKQFASSTSGPSAGAAPLLPNREDQGSSSLPSYEESNSIAEKLEEHGQFPNVALVTSYEPNNYEDQDIRELLAEVTEDGLQKAVGDFEEYIETFLSGQTAQKSHTEDEDALFVLPGRG